MQFSPHRALCVVPPLIHAAIAWLLGAFLGSVSALAHVRVFWWVVACVLLAATFLVLRRFFLAVCMALALAAIVHARVSDARQSACALAVANALARGDTVRAVFDDRVGPLVSSRGVASGRANSQDQAHLALTTCRVPISMRVAKGSAAPGEWVNLHGRALVTTRGLRVEGEILAVARSAREFDWRRAARGRTGEIIDRDFRHNAPLVRALLIADQDGIAPAVRDRFADAGLVHMLSISGLHVAIIAGSLLTLASAMRIGRTASYVATLVVIVVYVATLGAPPPAVRSAVMLAVVGLAERMQRPTHPWTALALGAVIPTLQPAVVLDLGWQLSVSGMAALVAARALLRRLRRENRRGYPRLIRRLLAWCQQLDGWRYTLSRELVTGVVATVVTAPLIAWTFGRVSLIAPLSNLAAGPLVAFIQPALFLALVAAPWPALSSLVADASAPPLAMLDAVARVSAAVPHAALQLAPTAYGAVCAGIASAAFIRATASRRWMPGLVVACAALTLAVWMPVFVRGSGELELHMLDVGQGDALAVRTPQGRWILVDAGRRWDGGDAGRRVVVPYVRRFGGPVAAFVMSHAHDDHVGGAASIVQALSPERWWEPAFVTSSPGYRAALVAFQSGDGRWRRVDPGDRWMLDGVEVRVLAPDSAWTAQQSDANETSVILRVAYRDVVFLLTGDAEEAEERWLLDHADRALLRADVLKLGHHGSKTSSSPDFLDAVEPRVGLASAGAGNRYGHPSPETLAEFSGRGIPVLRTDLEGTIVAYTDGKSVQIGVGRERWTLPERSPNALGLAQRRP